MFTPNPVDERRLRDCVTWFEREGDQQPAQPSARHVGEDAVVCAKLEGSKHPDRHLADFAMGGGPGIGRRSARHRCGLSITAGLPLARVGSGRVRIRYGASGSVIVTTAWPVLAAVRLGSSPGPAIYDRGRECPFSRLGYGWAASRQTAWPA
jgi:hypothetical protein